MPARAWTALQSSPRLKHSHAYVRNVCPSFQTCTLLFPCGLSLCRGLLESLRNASETTQANRNRSHLSPNWLCFAVRWGEGATIASGSLHCECRRRCPFRT